LVVGIFPGTDAKALEGALSAQQLDLSKVKVVSGRAEDDDECQLEFVDVIEDMEDNSYSDQMEHGLGMLDDSSGTGVPGLTSPTERYEPIGHQESACRKYFTGFDIPSDEIDNFEDAVADGRAVVLYPDAGSNSEAVAAAFKAAGLRNVRSY
jgi:rhodanese-related sulfurtransferase